MTDATVPAPPPAASSGARWWLVVMTDDGVETHALPPEGSVTIGREASCDVVIDRSTVSRRHATLALGAQLAIEDLGGRNGTHRGGVRLDKGAVTPIALGEIVHLGTVAVVVQRAGGAAESTSGELVVVDPKTRDLHDTLARVARGAVSVLLLGETGVGKEVCAEVVHRASPRAARPFVKLNCGALTETLLESELFGHVKGAFSGATDAKRGLIEAADGGTVFLDEVGELSSATQVKLLRVLEDRAVRRVGSVEAKTVDVRFVAATNRDLEAEAERGSYRLDLYYRLAGATVVIPPLRERPGEIEPLARAFLAAACRRNGQPLLELAPEALATLRAYRWPGNVRELRNVIERAVLLARGAAIQPGDLPDKLRAPAPAAPGTVPPAAGWWEPGAEEQEKARIIAALEQAGGHQGKAAELLGISRRTLINRLDALAIPRPRKR